MERDANIQFPSVQNVEAQNPEPFGPPSGVPDNSWQPPQNNPNKNVLPPANPSIRSRVQNGLLSPQMNNNKSRNPQMGAPSKYTYLCSI